MSAKGRGALFSLLTQEKSTTEESNFSKESNVDSGLCLNSIQTRGGELRRVGRGQLIKDLVSCSSLSTSLSSCSISKAEQKVGDHEIPALRNNNVGTPANIKKNDVQSMCSTEGSFIPYLPKKKQGNKGTPKNFACNYLRLNSNSEKGVYMYEVRFYPNVDSMNLRSKYLNEHRHNFGGVKTFDGTILFLPILLPEKLTTYKAKNVADGSDIEIRVMFKKKQTLKNCIHLYNILFDRVMKTLNYVRFDRKQYDPTDPKIIPQAKLEIWPGYVTAVDEYDGGLMLCCDVSHRLLCQKTVLEQLVEIHNASPSNFQDNAKKALLGSVVITRYNNQTYRIDAICFDKNPKSTFTTSSGEITFEEYYLKSHHITIADKKQPLLMSIKKQRCTDPQKNEEQIRCLIPELCFLTGLRDDIRSDYKLMREIASFTRVTPNQRIQALQKFYNNINNSTEAKKILSDWGLSLASSIEHVTGRTYDEESVFFKEKKFGIGVNADFGKYAVSNALIDVVALNKWVLVHCKSDTHAAKTFWEHLERNAKPLGVSILKPKIVVLDNDKIDTFVVALRENINPEVQMLVCICPNNRDDRYNAIKKICCAERPIASQVINAKTLSNPSRNRAIVQKIALQMNCKLGGSLWSVNIPFKNVMVCGIDSYHDASQKGNSVGAFVASLNATYTKWYSRAVMQTKGEEIVSGLCSSFIKALQAYKHSNRMLPDSVIIYRDGVGDGQLPLCAQHEIPQFENACKAAFDGYKIRITFIIVQKRINTRFYNVNGNSADNPPPGSIIDHSITRANMFDFFLVSQSVRQGTVTPTHYIVLRDDASYEPDILQRLSYKLCFLYYNWPGTIRVPACCQYAHKMAYLIGQNIRRNASEDLSMKLFYL